MIRKFEFHIPGGGQASHFLIQLPYVDLFWFHMPAFFMITDYLFINGCQPFTMKLVFYSLILNNHQANVADELWELTRHSYCFVELANLQAEHRKGDSHD